MERNYFASNLRYLRKINKVTQATIAEKYGNKTLREMSGKVRKSREKSIL